MIKPEYLYTNEHEWIKMDGTFGTVGISDHAQEELGEVTYVELPRIGQEVKKADPLCVIESSKAASDVFAPATGRVTEVNAELEDHPEWINDSCYDRGWICKLELTDPGQTAELMTADQYDAFLKEDH